ncbi:MAG: HD domain-containing protein [Roseovarius sp.]|nr:HD domain-containing protein [Roseovarius sp.]
MTSDRFDDALSYAARLHRSQRRKGANIPYISHLLSVCALVIEYGGDEDQAIAGLLHDAVEDQGGMEAARQIEARYGPRVARIVLECSDNDGHDKAPWRERKEAYLDGIAQKSDDAVLVTACDKLHNATTILHDLQSVGTAVFDRFTGRQDGTLWYYRALAETLTVRRPGPLAERLTETVAQIERAAA